jgi:hypothetical protein
MKNRQSLLTLYQSNTNKTTHTEHKIPGDGLQDQASRLGYWPDRSQHYSGW